MLRMALHLGLHFLAPAGIGRWAWPQRWRSAWLLMGLTNLVDLDHLLADPIFVANRCSLTTHPWHSPMALGVFAVLAVWPRTRVLGVGLVFHLAVDGLDCLARFV